MDRYALTLVIVTCIGLSTESLGANFKPVLTEHDPQMALLIEGEIVVGDSERFSAALDAAAARYTGHRMRAIALHSGGGLLAEAMKMAETIRSRGFVTVVPEGATCASACILLFAAGSRQIASTGASIGVHGAADATGGQNVGALAATTLLGKILADYGVPASVIGRMIVTPPDQFAWLTAKEIEMFPWGFAAQKFDLTSVPIALAGSDDELRGPAPPAIPKYQRAAPSLATPMPPPNTFGPAPPHSAELLQRATRYSIGYAYGVSIGKTAICGRADRAWQDGCRAGSHEREKFGAGWGEGVREGAADWLGAYNEAYTRRVQEWNFCGNGVAPSNDGCRMGARSWHRTETRK